MGVTPDTQIRVYITNKSCILDIHILRKEESEIRIPLCKAQENYYVLAGNKDVPRPWSRRALTSLAEPRLLNPRAGEGLVHCL